MAYLNSIDIKTAFFQGKKLIEPYLLNHHRKPTQVSMETKCVYRLANAPKCWYLRLKDELVKLGVNLCKYDTGLFYYLKNGKHISNIVCFVDHML